MAHSYSFQPGDAVRVRGERWRVLHVTAHDACAVIELAGADSGNRGTTARFLLPCDIADRLPRPAERPRFVRPSTWRRVALRALADAAPSWTSLRAAAGAGVSLFPFQLEPVLALTRGLADRVLLADEVGLGKTIQAGLILAELAARDRDARALIVTPAGLREQWRDELRQRFSIDSHILDAAGLARACARLPQGVNPWAVPQVVITSIDFVKRPDVIRSLEALVWDLVAFDEAHALGGSSDRAAAADLLARRGRRVIAITATPHTGDERAFARLCALGRLRDDDPMLMFRRSRLEAGLARNRSMRLLFVRPTPEEAAVHRALDAYARRVWHQAPAASAPAARLAMMVLARRASSSVASLARSLERRIALLGSPPGDLDTQLRLPLDDSGSSDDEPMAELAAPGLPDVAAEERWLERVLSLAREACARESKIAAVSRLLRRTGEPAIVFTEYRDTLERLSVALHHDGAPRLHGGLTTAERAREVRRFTHGDARLLLATDAASEGLNLHQRCRLVINLEVPWTPLRLEQRIGRVDRLGQPRRVHAIAFVATGTAEESVVRSLTARMATASQAAPFSDGGTASDVPPSGVTVVSLRSEAIEEAQRLEQSRIVGRGFTPRLAGRKGPPYVVDRRPVLAILRRHDDAALVWALRLLFVDDTGALVWETVAAPRWRSAPPLDSHTRLRAWLVCEMAARALPLAATCAAAHDSLLGDLRAALATPIGRLIAREEAILSHLRSHDARLAAPLVQAGLFDHRALRDADAQRRLADDATEGAAARIHRLRQFARPVAGDRHLLFAVVL